MVRKIIHIDEEKCNGCGICATACHEGAIDIVNGKAKLVREHFCDGLGDCLPECPTGAIAFEEREAPAYDHAAVLAAQEQKRSGGMREEHEFKMHEFKQQGEEKMQFTGCPGSAMMQFGNQREEENREENSRQEENPGAPAYAQPRVPQARLAQWPCQIKLVPEQAPFFAGAKLLIAADCTAYAYANMHEEFMRGKTTIIGCPKLDDVDYSEKLTEILRNNDIKSVTIVRMEVPCCGGLQYAAEQALQASGKFIPWQVVTISRDGRILD